jgi:F-type H+-transporting ATPase subunit a
MDLLPVELTNFVGNAGVGVDYFKLLPTADVNGPLALAIVVMFFVTYYTIATHGIGGFFKRVYKPN